jgi:N-acetylmuramoyl-L-alanine amidase
VTTSIKVGDRGPEVVDVQERLSRLGYREAAPDGQFGQRTLGDVRQFQRDRGLAADGIVGPETWRSLVEASFSLGDRLLWHTRRMMRGDDVLELQHRLNRLGFDAGPEDGIFGPLARAAVEEFQRNVGLDVDGVVGPATVVALQRLLRDHQSGGIGVRVRERETLRRLAGRGLVGARVLVDPAHGPGDPGDVGPSGTVEADVTWAIATRLAARLAARGAQSLLSRGPRSSPTQSQRARLANEQGVHAVISIAANSLTGPCAQGCTTYYFGAPQFTSEGGQQLAGLVQDAAVAGGWTPDCRVHPMTWPILRETRMPAVVVEPGFISSPLDELRLRDPGAQDELAACLADAIAAFFTGAFAESA